MRTLLVVVLVLALAGTAQGSDRVMGRTVVIGDSLGVGTMPYLQQVLGGTVRGNVKVGRSSADGVRQLQGLLRGGADRVVFDLGTNDGSASHLVASVKRAQQVAGGRPIYIPTVNGPGAAEKNAALRRIAGGNVRLVNWHNQSQGLTGPDGIHASGQGYRKRAEIVAHSIASAPTGSVRSASAGSTAQPQGAQMGWLEDFLAGTNTQQNALVAAAKQGVAPPRTMFGVPMHPAAEENTPQPPGPVGGVQDSVHLGQGLKTGALGGAATSSPFERYAANRHGRLMEAHDYGNGNVKWFARKNPALLQAAAKLAATRQAGGNDQAQQAVGAMSPEDQERIRRLLGV